MRYRVNLLDMWIDKVDSAGAVARIDGFVQSGRPHQVMTVNVDFLRLGAEDRAFHNLINAADLAVPDGMPLLWGAKLLGDPLLERVTGIDLIGQCAALSARKGYKIFLLGAGPGVAEEAAQALRHRYPGARIVGTYAPPMACTAEDDERTVRLVQEMQPDMLFVAFGAPKQDAWIRQHMQRLNVPMCMGVGGAFDMLAGRVKRAPGWMQRGGLEWAYRLGQEPTRLWKRYVVDDLPIFVRLMAQRRTGTRVAHAVTGLLAGPEFLTSEPATVTVEDAVAQESGFHVA